MRYVNKMLCSLYPKTFSNHSAAMIAFPCSKPASPANCLNLLVAFGIATLTILSLEYARRVHNGTLEHSDHIFSFYAKATEPSISQPSPSRSPSLTTPTQARYLPTSAIVTRPLVTSLTRVPKYFHQSWLNTTLPAKFSHWSRTCREQHPGWEWVLWTDADNEELMRRYVPWFMDTYLALPEEKPVYQADSARNVYMHVFGGCVITPAHLHEMIYLLMVSCRVYADLDVECLAPTEYRGIPPTRPPSLHRQHGLPRRARQSVRAKRVVCIDACTSLLATATRAYAETF